jgi:hypothetical protein
MSFINNIINNNNNNNNNINQMPNDTIIYDTVINSPNTSQSLSPSVVNDNINNEDEPPSLVEDIEDMLYGLITRYITVGYSRSSFNEIIRETKEIIETRETRKFNIAIHVVEQNDKLLEIECNICYQLHNNENFIKLNCNHEFCKECVNKILKSCRVFNDPCCAYCREQINTFTYKNKNIQTEFSDLIA